jgi:hypothetical protein
MLRCSPCWTECDSLSSSRSINLLQWNDEINNDSSCAVGRTSRAPVCRHLECAQHTADAVGRLCWRFRTCRCANLFARYCLSYLPRHALSCGTRTGRGLLCASACAAVCIGEVASDTYVLQSAGRISGVSMQRLQSCSLMSCCPCSFVFARYTSMSTMLALANLHHTKVTRCG